MRFNPPPNWSTPPAGWTPPHGWRPDPSWGPLPGGWPLWLDDAGNPLPTHSHPGAPVAKKHTLRNILLGAGGLVLVIAVIGSAAAGAGGDDPASGPEQALTADEAPAQDVAADAYPTPAAEPNAAPEPALPGIGSPVRDGEFEFVVSGVERVGKTIGEGYFEETAQGEFIVVRVDVRNIGDEPQMLSGSSQALYNDQGQKYETSSALFVLDDADKVFLENINPGNGITGAPLLFDVPVGTVVDRVELHDSMFSGGVEVSLR